MIQISTASKQTRKHVTTACIPCRETKVKCDGTKPVCQNCRHKRRGCHYRQRDDRRKVPVRVAVTLLAKRVTSLCRYIQDSGLSPPPMDGKDQGTLDEILQAYGLDDDQALSEARAVTPLATDPLSIDQPQSMHNSQISTRDEKTDQPIHSVSQDPDQASRLAGSDNSLENGRESQVIIPVSNNLNLPLPPIEPPNEDLHRLQPLTNIELFDAEVDDEVTTQLSCRLGKLQFTQDGQLRYFGSTSNLHLLDVLVSVTLPAPKIAEKETREILENARLNADIDEIFEKHLIELYFTWQDPSLHLVDCDKFWKARAQHIYDGLVSPYYSRSLGDAICALGAVYEPKYHPELVTFPRSLSEFFGDRARALLEWELENPSLATIQALVLLSNHEAASTRDTRGWLYSGMAMRLAFDLGLHVDMTPYVEKGIISADECRARRMVYWGVYLNEQFWGFYLGRSVHSPVVCVNVRKPGHDGPRTATRWKPYGCLSNSAQSIFNPLNGIFQQWVSLYDIMLPLTDVLYGCFDISKHALQALNENTVTRLIDWKNDLASELDFDRTRDSEQCLPHTLTLNMQYHQFMIHAHRPWISKHYIQPQPPQGPGSSHARKACLDSAIAIVKILMSYERLYGFRKTNVQIVSFTFSAALILIFTTVPAKSGKRNEEYMKYLSTCFWALEEMGGCFESAKRTSTFLSTLQQQWHKRKHAPAAQGIKRGPENILQSGKGKKLSRSSSVLIESPENNQTADISTGLSTIDSSGGSWSQDFDPLDVVDFMDPDLCNILLSEGIPRELV